jgi:hypothetical protein
MSLSIFSAESGESLQLHYKRFQIDYMGNHIITFTHGNNTIEWDLSLEILTKIRGEANSTCNSSQL